MSSLPVQHGRSETLKKLTSERLTSLRLHWINVTSIIIDEISMVSYNTMKQIYLRFNEIKGNGNTDVYFGGLNVLID